MSISVAESGLIIRPKIVNQLGKTGTFCIALCWGVFLFTPSQHENDIGIGLLIALTALGLGVSGWSWGGAIGNGAQILGALPLPNKLWQQWLRRALAQASIVWGVVTLIGIAVLLLKTTGSVIATAMLFSTVFSVGFIAGLVAKRVWGWLWCWMVTFAVFVLIILDSAQVFDWLLRGSFFWHLPLMLSWPLLALVLALRWNKSPPKEVVAFRKVRFSPLKSMFNYVARYSLIDLVTVQKQAALRRSLAALIICVGTIIWTNHISTVVKSNWGDQTGVIHLGALCFMVIFCSANVVCRDLHWRRMLAPNGFHRGQIGWHLIASTLSISLVLIFAIALFLSVCIFAVGKLGVGVSTTTIFDYIKAYRLMPLEIVLAICVGVVLRANSHPVRMYLISIFSLVLIVFTFLWLSFQSQQNVFPKWMTFSITGPSYAICLILGIVTSIWLANRLWTIELLLPYVVGGAAGKDEKSIGGKWMISPFRRFY